MEGSREAAMGLILRRMKAAGLDTGAVEGLYAMHQGAGHSPPADLFERGWARAEEGLPNGAGALVHNEEERGEATLAKFDELGRRALLASGRDPAKPHNRGLLEGLRGLLAELFIPQRLAFEIVRGATISVTWRDEVEEDWQRLVETLGEDGRISSELAQIRDILDKLIEKEDDNVGEDHESRRGIAEC